MACEDLRDLRNLRRTRAAWVILVARLAFQTTFVVVDMPPLLFPGQRALVSLLGKKVACGLGSQFEESVAAKSAESFAPCFW